MLALLKAASGADTFGAWLKHSESIAARRTEKLDSYLEVLYMLLSDVLRLTEGLPAGRNADIGTDLKAVAARVSFDWLRRAVEKVDELVDLVRRNIQKSIALDAWAVDMLSTK
jgi:DNA polymerase III subunit delta'